MQTRKLSSTKMTFAFIALILVMSICFIVPSVTKSEKSNISAAVDSVTVNFTGFPTNGSVSPFCAVRFLNKSGTTFNAMVTTSGKNFELGSGAEGKLEITVPMYSRITSTLPTHIQNNCTYYIDITSSTSLSSITITYTDQGYFSSTTII